MPARIKIDDPENLAILRLLAEGFDLREAADELGWEANTTRKRVYAMKAEMGVNNNVALIYRATKKGMI